MKKQMKKMPIGMPMQKKAMIVDGMPKLMTPAEMRKEKREMKKEKKDGKK